MPVTDDSEPTGSIIYRATIRFGLPTLVLGWTAVSVSLSGIVTALMIEVLWGNVHWTDLEFTSAVTCIVTVPIAYMIGKLMRALNLSRDSLKRLAQIDALTGLANRGYFFRRAEQLVQDQSATVWPLSALMIDVDHFKSINDESGHAAGDQVLAAVARLLEQNLRRDDFVARYGGEEFAAMLPKTDNITAMAIAERMRIAICEDALLRKVAQHPVTISVGVSEATSPLALDSILLAADRALYTAKAAGRNRCAFLDVATALSATARVRALKAATPTRDASASDAA